MVSTEICRNQAFTWGPAALAFQCHPEVRARDLEKWFAGHAVEIAAASGVNVPSLRDSARRYGAALECQGTIMFTEWMGSLKL